MKLIKPLQSHEQLLQDIRTASADPNRFHLWWLGQSGFLIKWGNRYCLTDPYLSDSLTRKYAQTDNPHTRMTEPAIDPEKLNFIDVVTSSHNHTDHLDAETLLPMIKENPDLKLIVPEANREFVTQRLQTDNSFPIGLDEGICTTVKGFTFTGVPAAHEEIERDDVGRCKYMSYLIQFGQWTVYHSGDTLVYENMATILKPFNVDVALLPINGRAPERRVAGNMNAQEAVQLAKQIEATMVIPHHYNMFTFNTEDPDKFARIARATGQRFWVLECGERWSSDNLAPN